MVPKIKSPSKEKKKKSKKPQPLAYKLEDYFEQGQVDRFKEKVFKLAGDIESLAKRPGEKVVRPWRVDDTNLAGLTSYKEAHCWRHVFELDKENSQAEGNSKASYQPICWDKIKEIMDTVTTREVQSRKTGASMDQIRNHLRQAYETRLVAIGFTRVKAMEAVQALFEEGSEPDEQARQDYSRAQTVTSAATSQVPKIDFKTRELTSAERNNV